MQPTESFCRSVRSSLTAVASRSGVCLLKEPRKNLQSEAYLLPIKVPDKLEAAHPLLPFTLSSQQTSLISPLFTSGEGGPPAAPGPSASCWQKRGTEARSTAVARDICPFPRYLMATGRCTIGARRLVKCLNLTQKGSLELLACYERLAAGCASLYRLRHGRRPPGGPCAALSRLPKLCCVMLHCSSMYLEDSSAVNTRGKALPKPHPTTQDPTDLGLKSAVL